MENVHLVEEFLGGNKLIREEDSLLSNEIYR